MHKIVNMCSFLAKIRHFEVVFWVYYSVFYKNGVKMTLNEPLDKCYKSLAILAFFMFADALYVAKLSQ